MNGVTRLPSLVSSPWLSSFSPSLSVMEESKEEDDRGLWIGMFESEVISVRGSPRFIGVLMDSRNVRGWTMTWAQCSGSTGTPLVKAHLMCKDWLASQIRFPTSKRKSGVETW